MLLTIIKVVGLISIYAMLDSWHDHSEELNTEFDTQYSNKETDV